MISGALCAERLSSTTWICSPLSTFASICLKNAARGGRVALVAVGEDLTGRDVERGEQVGGAVALVVMGHRAGSAWSHRQAGLGAVQGLALGLLVEAAEHHRPPRGVPTRPATVLASATDRTYP